MEAQTFRPRHENEMSYRTIRVWCEEHGTTMSAVINSIIEPLAYALENKRQEGDGIIINMDFGDIQIQ